MKHTFRSRNFLIGAGFAVALGALAVGHHLIARAALAQGNMAPKFEVNPFWPKPLPNHWIMGMAIGVWVDNNDHIWMVHRANTVDRTESQLQQGLGECCQAAPPVLEFDEEGNLLHAWGGPGKGYDWPESNHGIFVDQKGNVWIGGNGGPDSQILKFTQDGKFLMQYGKSGARRKAGTAADANAEASEKDFAADSNDPNNFGRVAKIFVDPKENEAYIADGYLNHRVAVIDADTGKMKRWWGAYGNKPDDTPLGPYDPAAPHAQQFRNPVHCAMLSNDNLLYVCDRVNDRIQVFHPDGTFVKEAFIEKQTLGSGSVWDIAFSRDPQQKFLYVADGENDRVHIVDRETLEVLTTFGEGGRQPGEFYGVHSIATDSKGNIFTTETYRGQRVQKFLYKGLAAVTKKDQGPAWPKSGGK